VNIEERDISPDERLDYKFDFTGWLEGATPTGHEVQVEGSLNLITSSRVGNEVLARVQLPATAPLNSKHYVKFFIEAAGMRACRTLLLTAARR
jgi:hypothetical protein